jgi:NADPH:quinone reductase
MRAFSVLRFGEAPAIHDLPVPPADGAFLIRVSYAGVNPMDTKQLARLSASSTYPYIVGIDFAGVLERIPAGERDLKVGDRVLGLARTQGSYAEHTAMPIGVKIEPMARIPDGVTDEQAAALPMPGITALGSLEMLGVRSGEHVVIMGGNGGVGGYAVQMARARGAHVIATVRGDPEEARRLGAEEVFDTTAVDVFSAVHAAHPDGVDAVLDLVNGRETIRRDAEMLKPGGRLVSTIFAADEQWFSDRHVAALNISNLSNNPMSSPEGLNQVTQMLVDGKITARLSLTAPLDEATAVLEKLRTGGLRGKAVLHI